MVARLTWQTALAAALVAGVTGCALQPAAADPRRPAPRHAAWGRLRYGEVAAQAQSEAPQADFAYARQSLAAMVAESCSPPPIHPGRRGTSPAPRTRSVCA